ncbi:MAG: molybdopterin-dependent oxidoreductase [Chloroflexi bacterium]|nr:molybdopterin-dependent oxidoreductase [Chloroflexota bacterium]
MVTITKPAEKIELDVVGKPVPRVDAREKVQGKTVFGYDLKFPHMLHGKVLRSQYAHAHIVSIDVSRAKALPGVKAVVTGKDIPAIHGPQVRDQPFMPIDKVRYRGEGVAAVAAVTEEIAEAALALIDVEYEELPSVFDAVEAMKPNAPQVHPGQEKYHREGAVNTPIPGTNCCYHFKLRRGDVEAGFAQADYVFEDTFTTQMVQHCAMEPHASIAQVDGAGKVTIWTHNDSPYRCRQSLSEALGMPMSKIRVIAPYQGGGFGGKGGLNTESYAVALALRTKNIPVRVAFSREEVFTSALVRHPSVVHIKSGIKKDGSLVARKVTIYWNTGAYAEKGPTVCRQASYPSAGPYDIPNVWIDGYCVYTNSTIAGAFRGYGAPQVCWAYESHTDIISRKMEWDPLWFRLRNAFQKGSLSATGETLTSIALKETIQRAAEAVGWGRGRAPNRGRGIACMHRNTNSPSSSNAFIKINEDGTVDVLTSTLEIGQGAYTVLSQMVAETLGVPIENVVMVTPDSDITPYDMSTTASRSTFHMGNAVLQAAADAKGQLLELASRALKVPMARLKMQDGRIFVSDEPDKGMTIPQVIVSRYGSRGGNIIGKGQYFPEDITSLDRETGQGAKPTSFWMYATQAAEVEVDPETGRVHVLKLVAAHDLGKTINPVTSVQQIEGGIITGLGSTLFEELLFDGAGVTLNPDFANYKIPTAMDVPPIQPILVEDAPHPDGPFGAKGLGEPVLAPTAAAIANAIFDAVGVRIKDLPISAEKVRRALKAAP